MDGIEGITGTDFQEYVLCRDPPEGSIDPSHNRMFGAGPRVECLMDNGYQGGFGNDIRAILTRGTTHGADTQSILAMDGSQAASRAGYAHRQVDMQQGQDAGPGDCPDAPNPNTAFATWLKESAQDGTGVTTRSAGDDGFWNQLLGAPVVPRVTDPGASNGVAEVTGHGQAAYTSPQGHWGSPAVASSQANILDRGSPAVASSAGSGPGLADALGTIPTTTATFGTVGREAMPMRPQLTPRTVEPQTLGYHGGFAHVDGGSMASYPPPMGVGRYASSASGPYGSYLASSSTRQYHDPPMTLGYLSPSRHTAVNSVSASSVARLAADLGTKTNVGCDLARVENGRLCPTSRGPPSTALPLSHRKVIPRYAPTTLPGAAEHHHELGSILVDHGYFPETTENISKTCKDILNRCLTDPNLGPAQRTSNIVTSRATYTTIPADATAAERAYFEAKNRQVDAFNKARSRESNRASAERKRHRERLHQVLLGQKVVELEPERNFWMAVAVAHGAQADL